MRVSASAVSSARWAWRICGLLASAVASHAWTLPACSTGRPSAAKPSATSAGAGPAAISASTSRTLKPFSTASISRCCAPMCAWASTLSACSNCDCAACTAGTRVPRRSGWLTCSVYWSPVNGRSVLSGSSRYCVLLVLVVKLALGPKAARACTGRCSAARKARVQSRTPGSAARARAASSGRVRAPLGAAPASASSTRSERDRINGKERPQQQTRRPQWPASASVGWMLRRIGFRRGAGAPAPPPPGQCRLALRWRARARCCRRLRPGSEG